MFLTSIILVVDRYFEDQEIIVENLKSANSSLELLILKNLSPNDCYLEYSPAVQEIKDRLGDK